MNESEPLKTLRKAQSLSKPRMYGSLGISLEESCLLTKR